MHGNTENEVSEELLNEEVTPAELREILKRLGQREFGGSPNSTIRDIAEGTSADPLVIGRLLAEIRNEELQSRLGLQVEEHEHRIEHIEHVQAEVQRQHQRRPVDPLAGLDFAQVEELRNIADERRRGREVAPIILAITLIAVCLIWIFIAAASNSSSSDGYDQPKTTYTIYKNGVEISGSMGGPFTAKENGKTRPATADEESELMTTIAISEANRNNGR